MPSPQSDAHALSTRPSSKLVTCLARQSVFRLPTANPPPALQIPWLSKIKHAVIENASCTSSKLTSSRFTFARRNAFCAEARTALIGQWVGAIRQPKTVRRHTRRQNPNRRFGKRRACVPSAHNDRRHAVGQNRRTVQQPQRRINDTRSPLRRSVTAASRNSALGCAPRV